jgi:hypothetical protein
VQPNYQPPIVKRKKDDCFIATATMGDHAHPYIEELRYFRDYSLNQNRFSRKFIRYYYRYSSHLARLLKKSFLLRLISFYCIVKPAVALARIFR